MNTAVIIFLVVGLIVLIVIGKTPASASASSAKAAPNKGRNAAAVNPSANFAAYYAAMTAAAAAAEANETNSAARAPGAGNNNSRYSHSLDANSNDPWAALGGIEALTGGTTTTIQMEQTHSSSDSTSLITVAASTQRRRRSRHVSFLPPIDAISPMPAAPTSPPPPLPAINSSLGPGRMRPSASTPSMAQIQMPTPVYHSQHQQQSGPQLRGILRNSNSSANIHRTPPSSATTPNNRSVFPIYPLSPDPLAAMRRPDSFMPGEEVAVSRNDLGNEDEDGRYSQPPPSYDAVMASTRYESNNRAS
ncbi:hypothetical protein IWW48_003584 [Coemansia sp. RSA 1200]|nr:hypothetical protein IWW48_003584 [Coemansia sp. RSA 1200]